MALRISREEFLSRFQFSLVTMSSMQQRLQTTCTQHSPWPNAQHFWEKNDPLGLNILNACIPCRHGMVCVLWISTQYMKGIVAGVQERRSLADQNGSKCYDGRWSLSLADNPTGPRDGSNPFVSVAVVDQVYQGNAPAAGRGRSSCHILKESIVICRTAS